MEISKLDQSFAKLWCVSISGEFQLLMIPTSSSTGEKIEHACHMYPYCSNQLILAVSFFAMGHVERSPVTAVAAEEHGHDAHDASCRSTDGSSPLTESYPPHHQSPRWSYIGATFLPVPLVSHCICSCHDMSVIVTIRYVSYSGRWCESEDKLNLPDFWMIDDYPLAIPSYFHTTYLF